MKILVNLASLTLLFLLASCASDKDLVQGYDGAMLTKAKKAVIGKTPQEVAKLLGAPALQGKNRGIFTMIYLTQDMRRFYLELSYNTDQSIDCLVLDFYPDKKTKQYVFDSKKGIRKQRNCNHKEGAILSLQATMDQEEKEAAAKKK